LETTGLKYTSETDIAWAAGIFEGEGCLSYTKVKDSWSFQIEMCDKDIIDKLVTIFPLNVTESKRRNRPEHHVQPYIARISARDVVFECVCTIYPYLGLRRREKCDEFIAWYEAKQ
tara:strand:- start:1540 stop:1887 length:348 start_codon:yes stop_codon:yes gene_type:complete